MGRHCWAYQTQMHNIININIDSIDVQVAKNKACHANIKTVQGLMLSRKKREEGSAVQTQTACQNLPTTAKGQWPKLIPINQQTTSLHVPTVIVTKRKVLNQHNKYTKNLMMCLMALDALKAHIISS